MKLKYDNTNNVQYTETMWDINGIKEYVLIYPKFESDTLLIHIHGGPGEPNSIYAPLFFPSDLPCSLLFYDQRGSGKTQLANRKIQYETDIDHLVTDLYETIIKAKKVLEAKKIILIAHSFGGILAMEFFKKYPDVVSGYIGVGQIISTKQAEKKNFDELYGKIMKVGYSEEDKDLIKLLKNDNYPYVDNKDDYLTDLQRIRYLSNSYNRSYINMPTKRQLLKSYIVRFKDYKWINHLDKTLLINKKLVDYIIDYNIDVFKFNFPVFFITGETDYIAPPDLVLDYLSKINAPILGFYKIINSSHRPQYENKRAFLTTLRDMLYKIEAHFSPEK